MKQRIVQHRRPLKDNAAATINLATINAAKLELESIKKDIETNEYKLKTVLDKKKTAALETEKSEKEYEDASSRLSEIVEKKNELDSKLGEMASNLISLKNEVELLREESCIRRSEINEYKLAREKVLEDFNVEKEKARKEIEDYRLAGLSENQKRLEEYSRDLETSKKKIKVVTDKEINEIRSETSKKQSELDLVTKQVVLAKERYKDLNNSIDVIINKKKTVDDTYLESEKSLYETKDQINKKKTELSSLTKNTISKSIEKTLIDKMVEDRKMELDLLDKEIRDKKIVVEKVKKYRIQLMQSSQELIKFHSYLKGVYEQAGTEMPTMEFSIPLPDEKTIWENF